MPLPPPTHSCWTQQSPTTWHQPYGTQDKFYNSIRGPIGHPALFLIYISITFSYDGPFSSSDEDFVSALRHAWVLARHRYPALACTTGPTGKIYETADEAVDEWLSQSYRVLDKPEMTSEDVFAQGIRRKYATLFYLPRNEGPGGTRKRQVSILTDHSLLDGQGVFHVLDAIFRAVVSTTEMDLHMPGLPVVFGHDEIARLPARYDDLVDMGGRAGNGPAKARGWGLAEELMKPLIALEAGGDGEREMTPICLPVADVSARPTTNVQYKHGFSEETSLLIARACKQRHISVTAAWHAATVLATRECQITAKVKPGSHYGVLGNFNLRSLFPAPRDGSREDVRDLYAGGNYHTVLPTVVECPPDKETGLVDVARPLTAFYKTSLAKKGVFAALPGIMEMVGSGFVDGQPPLDTTPALSSLGLVDLLMKHVYEDEGSSGAGLEWGGGIGGEKKGVAARLVVEDLWGGDTVSGPWVECFLWGWRGRLWINGCWNRAFYTDGEVEGLLARVARILVDGLGVRDGDVNGGGHGNGGKRAMKL